MESTKVTIVAVPRDHFSDTRESLESIYEYSDLPFALVYVDGGSPRRVARYLEEQAARRKFRLVRTAHYLSPNHARNLGAREVHTPYVIFVDNDVVVAPGWLGPLVDCAERTGAAVVSPLCFEQRPLHSVLHFAGGAARVETREANGRTERHLVDEIHKTRVPGGRVPTELAEFHCMLVRTEAFRAVGGLDERMLSTRENLDFCMALREAGQQVYLEPASRITYLPPLRMRLSDVPYFALRWSDDWDLSSFRYFQNKWNLAEDAYFAREYRNLGWRRQHLMMLGGLLRWIPTWRIRLATERLLRPLERRVNQMISARYARRYASADSA